MPWRGSCRICAHARVLEINAELLAPNMNMRSLRGVAHLFDVNSETLRRHYRNCLGQVATQEQTNVQQVIEVTPARGFRFSQELVDRAVFLSEKSQMCGSPTQMVIIARELAKLLADLVQDVGNK